MLTASSSAGRTTTCASGPSAGERSTVSVWVLGLVADERRVPGLALVALVVTAVAVGAVALVVGRRPG